MLEHIALVGKSDAASSHDDVRGVAGPTTRGGSRPPPRSKRSKSATILGRVAISAATALLVALIVAGLTGYFWLGRIRDDPLQRADAVVVLGGEHDGRESYGLQVAGQVSARTLLLSDPYPAGDPVMRHACAGRRADITVICRRPDPPTTRGEALQTRALAEELHWKRIVVVSWRHHLLRARVIFSQCLAPLPVAVIMRGVPNNDPISLAEWEYVSVYQELALLKAGAEGACS